MQIADLVIVDVSSPNPNVFYEFGMAVALHKLILPICYSGSYYQFRMPFDTKRIPHKARLKKEQHIGCYPWCKELFEYYGISYQSQDDHVHYLNYSTVIKPYEGRYFDDIIYDRFPYDAPIKGKKMGNKIRAGQIIYDRLKTGYEHAKGINALVLYTMEGFLNEDQAGSCIINYFNYITKPMQEENCFCGERVGVLVQNHPIPENDKDKKDRQHVLYNTGEIIHIGVNEATYQAMNYKIKSPEFEAFMRQASHQKTEITEEVQREIVDSIKEHISNRGIIIYVQNPVYVDRLKKHNNLKILAPYSISGTDKQFFCFYYVMLRTLCYVNQLVVDITDNSTQALFWLGAAHASNIYAVTVIHEYTDEERKMLALSNTSRSRNVFDVAGLWTAFYYSNDADGFYRQLLMVQLGIERHSRLMLSETERRKKESRATALPSDETVANIEQSARDKVLESYYRRRFWSPMLRYNRLHIYLRQCDDEIYVRAQDAGNYEIRAIIPKWDFDAVSKLTSYLSTHTVIGEYRVIGCPDNSKNEEIALHNFICIGSMSSIMRSWMNTLNVIIPEWKEKLSVKLSAYSEYINVLHERYEWPRDTKQVTEPCSQCPNPKKAYQIGFKRTKLSKKSHDIHSDHYGVPCSDCDNSCRRKDGVEFTQIAQLILWREDKHATKKQSHFRVALNGSSGPATYALSSLFINDEGGDQAIVASNILCKLQKSIRDGFLSIFETEMDANLRKINQPNVKTTSFTVMTYLSTMMYRYFLPLLSYHDRVRIPNELRMYMESLIGNKNNHFQAITMASIDTICDTLKSFLNRFKGIEAYFDVDVVTNLKSNTQAIDSASLRLLS